MSERFRGLFRDRPCLSFMYQVYSGTPDSVSVFQMEDANAALFGPAVFTYALNAVDAHLPVSWMSLSDNPAFPIIVGKPALKLWDVSGPSVRSSFPARRIFKSLLNICPV